MGGFRTSCRRRPSPCTVSPRECHRQCRRQWFRMGRLHFDHHLGASLSESRLAFHNLSRAKRLIFRHEQLPYCISAHKCLHYMIPNRGLKQHQYVARYPFHGHESGQLSFAAGHVIECEGESDDNWQFGTNLQVPPSSHTLLYHTPFCDFVLLLTLYATIISRTPDREKWLVSGQLSRYSSSPFARRSSQNHGFGRSCCPSAGRLRYDFYHTHLHF